MQELFISKEENKKKIALVENGKLQEYYEENDEKTRLEGNIYIGKVKDVIPGMQAAFIDIGEEKTAFIHVKDIIPKINDVTGNKNEDISKYKISDYIKQNDLLLVQVKKDSINTKGARVTTDIQIVGRFVILLPESNFITVSHRISDEKEKERLKSIVKKIIGNKKCGIIVRTSAENKSEELIKKDIENLIKKKEEIYSQFDKKEKLNPKVILKSSTILEKILLDLMDNSLDRIIVDDEKLQEDVKKIIKEIDSNFNVKIDFKNISDDFELNKQIEKIKDRKIWLKCGGFITIDKTEALTAIDVNSGKYVGNKNLEQTVYKVNKEATIEIAKQLRLKDIGGIIVIDYIDMFDDDSQNEIIKLLNEELLNDRAKTQVLEFTKLGLLEMTRKHMFSGE